MDRFFELREEKCYNQLIESADKNAFKIGGIQMNKDVFFKEAQGIAPGLVELRRHLHRHPGLGFDIPVSLEVVERELTQLGYTVEKCGKAGLVTTIGNGKGPVFLMRGDMDALPIFEETDLSFKSTNDNMHACGHDFHTVMLLGAAQLLKKHEAEINGTVKLMFQPAEEIMEGAHDMIEAGVLENPKVDAGMMIHVAPAMPLEDGTVIVGHKGIMMASCDWLEIHIYGKSGHGAIPHEAVDAMIPMANILLALQEIHGREISVDEKVALTFGEVHGGTTSNIIADHVVLKGTLRTNDDTLRVKIKERIVEIVETMAQVYRCRGEVNYLAGAPTLINSPELIELANNEIPGYLPAGKFVSTDDFTGLGTIMASEDFAYVSQEIPTVLYNLAAADSRLSEPYPVHHPKLVLNEDVIPYGVTTYVATAFEYLASQQ